MTEAKPAPSGDQGAGRLLNTKRQRHEPNSSARHSASRGADLLKQLRRRFEAAKKLQASPEWGRR